eukprot:1196304-Prorocentrum_minimum.AAC.4
MPHCVLHTTLAFGNRKLRMEYKQAVLEFGNDHTETFERATKLADLCYHTGRYDEAEPLLRQCLAIAEVTYSAHISVFRCQGQISGFGVGRHNSFREGKPLCQAVYFHAKPSVAPIVACQKPTWHMPYRLV